MQAIMRIFAVAALLMLAACARPDYYTPQVDEAEIKQERDEQLALAKQVDSETLKEILTRPVEEQERIDMSYTLQKAGKRIQKAGSTICRNLTSAGNPCVYEFVLDKENPGPNAYANGTQIVVSPAMLRFTKNEGELAVVLAHEYAHNAVQHPQKTTQNATLGSLLGLALDSVANSQGVNVGNTFSRLGGQIAVMQYSQDFEREADYIGLYIMEAAGYDASKAPDFWRRMAQQNPKSITFAATHPTTSERYVLLKKTYNEISSKRKIGMPMLPEKLPAQE